MESQQEKGLGQQEKGMEQQDRGLGSQGMGSSQQGMGRGPQRELEVTVLSAQDLKNVKMTGGTMNPYCVVWVYPHIKKATSVNDGGGVNPTWNSTIKLPVEESTIEQGNANVTVEIYNHGRFSNKFIGSVLVPLRDLKAQQNAAPSYQVHSKSGKPKGMVRVALKVGRTLTEEEVAKAAPPVMAYPMAAGMGPGMAGMGGMGGMGTPMGGMGGMGAMPMGGQYAQQYPQQYAQQYPQQYAQQYPQPYPQQQYVYQQVQPRRSMFGGGMGGGFGGAGLGLGTGLLGGMLLGDMMGGGFGDGGGGCGGGGGGGGCGGGGGGCGGM